TWAVLVWEVGFGGFVLLHWLREMLGRPRRFPDLRKPFLGFGVLMHLGIQAMLYVAWFTPLMIAAYAAWLTPQEVQRLGAWLRRRRRGRARAGSGDLEQLDAVDGPAVGGARAVAAEHEPQVERVVP